MRYIFLIFLALDISAQSIHIKLTQRKNPFDGEVYEFPKVVVEGQKTISQKINNVLREDMLSAPKNEKDENIFNNVWMKKGMPLPVVSDISYETIDLSKSIICLSISAEGCGAYCEGFTRYFVFDPKTGNQLKLDSLFTKEGLNHVVSEVNKNKTALIKEKLKEIADTLKKTKRDIVESYTEMKEMYTECLSLKSDLSYIPNMPFTIKKGILTVITARCSSHMNMALEDLWEFKTDFTLKKQTGFLTKLGSTIFLNG
jgi:hypothetical protein